MKYLNTNLLSLKCVLFLFFGAIGSLLPFLPHHMTSIGLFKDESIVISVIAPLIALIGPLVAAPLADRLAGGFGGSKRSKTGTYLRVMIAVCFLLATIFYWLLMAIPRLERSPPEVSFYCDENEGYILQKQCGGEKKCYDWGTGKGTILVKNCKFTCNASVTYKGDDTERNTLPPSDLDDHYSGEDIPQYAEELPEITTEFDPGVRDQLEFSILHDSFKLSHKRHILKEPNHSFVPYPHMCFWNSTESQICAVFTEHTQYIPFHLGLKPNLYSPDNESESDTCTYPVADRFHCRIHTNGFKELVNNSTQICKPVIQCAIHDPYNNSDSLLKISQCGYDNVGYWLYLFIRSFADMFTVTSVTLLATAVVIATRETSTGRGDIGKQYAAGALGLGIFAPIIGATGGDLFNAMICFTVLMILATIVILFDTKMPLSPPEWWWHTRCGLLALPMSSVRKYGIEIAALVFALLLLGIFWNAIDSFLPWHAVKLERDLNTQTLVIGLTITVAAIPAVIFLIFAEKIVDYCGHSNILILCFLSYIGHHLGLMFIERAMMLLLCEVLEIITLHIMYMTAILYLRHLVPRKLTACGQALPVIAHFCIGRCIGALLGGIAYSGHPSSFQSVHKWFSVSAAIVAAIYFVIYHFCLRPKYAAPLHVPPDPAPAVVQTMNGNGAYTPLRVYHNSKSKKGHFRY